MNAHLKEAFARLKPICDMVMVSPSPEHISPFIGVVCGLNKEILQELQQYMLFPFITHLQSKEIEYVLQYRFFLPITISVYIYSISDQCLPVKSSSVILRHAYTFLHNYYFDVWWMYKIKSVSFFYQFLLKAILTVYLTINKFIFRTKYDLQELLIFGMKEVLKKIKVNSFEMCMKIEMGLLSLVFEKPKPGMSMYFYIIFCIYCTLLLF